jgi:hypothetical protein
MTQWIDSVVFILVASVFMFFAFLFTATAIRIGRGDHDE